MRKIYRLLLLLAVTWLVMTWSYRMFVTMKLQTELQKTHGPGVIVKSLRFNNWYLQSDLRHGTAKAEDKEPRADRIRGLDTVEADVTVKVEGRFWPTRITPDPVILPRQGGNKNPLRPSR